MSAKRRNKKATEVYTAEDFRKARKKDALALAELVFDAFAQEKIDDEKSTSIRPMQGF